MATLKRTASDDIARTTPHKIRRSAAEAPKTGTRTVAVHVGSGTEKRTFDIYQDTLIRHSEFFKAALNPSSNWMEGQQRSVSLPEDCPQNFEILFHFLNTGSIFASKEDDISGTSSTSCPLDLEWGRLTECWALGQKLLSTTYKDAVVDTIIEKMRTSGRFCSNLHEYPCQNSTPSRAFRKLLVDVVVYRWSQKTWAEIGDGLSSFPDFLLDIARAQSKISKKGFPTTLPWAGDDCTYHEHMDDGTPCYKTLF
ncbi:hypothetical protein LTR56_027396 [Elasticomyces elasticus]|nr:hypothetical protein LTR56_027396 [Elasticomyces elasticus]KAK3633185.1 hypothetical protein LTR22_020261 [Elasticomyces elasticus]KAK4922372.1 hypothetical protein LTR49_010237 [Elasticomyces elasticus]KAK5765253.1 hypothetical protein LTS12_004510 [Elasticomyces elasticus]